MSELFGDLKKVLPQYQPEVIFDVGANVGQTVNRLRKEFPTASIYSFEPVPEAFEILKSNTAHHTGVQYFNFGLSRQAGTAKMLIEGTSIVNRIINPAEKRDGPEIRLEAGDAFCRERGIDHISILKIDTEAHDLDVLLGFVQMLSTHSIDFIQVETSMNPYNRFHVPFQKMNGFLEPLGYVLFRIYDQALEKNLRPILRFSNPAYVSSTLALQSQRTK